MTEPRKGYVDASTTAAQGETQALANYVDRVFAEYQRALDVGTQHLDGRFKALREYVDAIFHEHERAVTLVREQAGAQAKDLNGTTARLEYVNAVFQEHRRAIDGSLSGNARAIEGVLVQVSANQVAQQRAVEVALVQVEQRILAVQDVSSERVSAVQQAALAALGASEKAIVKSEISTEKRFEAVNEFRAQLADQTRTFMPREVADALITELRRSAENQIAELRNQMASLQQRMDQSTGSSAGATKSIGYVITAVGIGLTVMIFIANFLSR